MLSEHAHLAFEPVSRPHPKTLGAKQIDHYNERGYVAPLEVFSPAEIADARAYFDGLLARLDGRDAYALNCYQARCAGIWDLCTEPRILDLVEDIVGRDVVCWASHLFCKLAHDPKAVPWHQDAIYWHLAPARTVTVWLAIDDVDAGNSAMEFRPCTHDRGVLEWRAPDAKAARVLDREIIGADALGEPVSKDLAAGQVSLQADMLAHGSRPNRSARRRCGLRLRYCPPEVGFSDPRWAEGVEAIVCRGSDPSGRWRRHPRPDGDDVSPKSRPRSFGGS